MKISTNGPSSLSWTKEKMATLLEKQRARLRSYKAALDEHRILVIILFAVILFMSLLFALLFMVHLGLARDHQRLVAFGPHKIHLFFDDSKNSIVVEWFTRNRTDHSIVWYGPKAFTSSAIGYQQKVEKSADCGLLYKHQVLLGDLLPGINYKYKVGSDEVFSEVRYFKLPDKIFFPAEHRIFQTNLSPPKTDPVRPTSDEAALLDETFNLEKMVVDNVHALDGLIRGVIEDIDSLVNKEVQELKEAFKGFE